MAWTPKKPHPEAPSPNQPTHLQPTERSCPPDGSNTTKQFRASALIRLVSILVGALFASIGVQGATKFGFPWLPYVCVPAALAIVAWAIGYQVWAFEGKLIIRTAMSMRTLDLVGLNHIVLVKMAAPLGKTRNLAIFVKDQRTVDHYANLMLSASDFTTLLEWTRSDLVNLPGRWTSASLASAHPELSSTDQDRPQIQLAWTVITLVLSALFVGAFFYLAYQIA